MLFGSTGLMTTLPSLTGLMAGALAEAETAETIPPSMAPVDAASRALSLVAWVLVLLILIPIAVLVYRKFFTTIREAKPVREKNPLEEAERLVQRGDHLAAAEAFERGGNRARAAELFEKGRDLARAAELYEFLGDIDRAISLHLRSGGSLRAAGLYIRTGQYLEAAKIFKNKGDHLRAAQALEKFGNRVAAAREYREAGQHARAARLYREEGLFPEAAETFGLSIQGQPAAPGNLDAHYTWGAYLLMAGDRETAGDIFRTILAVDPGHDKARARLTALLHPAQVPAARSSAVMAAPPAPPAPTAVPAGEPLERMAPAMAPEPQAPAGPKPSIQAEAPAMSMVPDRGAQVGSEPATHSQTPAASPAPEPQSKPLPPTRHEASATTMGPSAAAAKPPEPEAPPRMEPVPRSDTPAESPRAVTAMAAAGPETSPKPSPPIRPDTFAASGAAPVVPAASSSAFPAPAHEAPPPVSASDMESLSLEISGGETEEEDPFERVITLRNMIGHTRLEPRYSMRLWVQMMKALAAKHRENTFYGCLTPEQVLIDMQNNARFEIAWVTSPVHTAPEVLAGAVPDARSDIYSMGVILYEMVAGSLESFGRKRPSEVREDVPAWLDGFVMQCLESDRDKRFGSTDEVSAALLRLRSSL
jgi:tetratricopeptide (TPR) repeat protein